MSDSIVLYYPAAKLLPLEIEHYEVWSWRKIKQAKNLGLELCVNPFLPNHRFYRADSRTPQGIRYYLLIPDKITETLLIYPHISNIELVFKGHRQKKLLFFIALYDSLINHPKDLKANETLTTWAERANQKILQKYLAEKIKPI